MYPKQGPSLDNEECDSHEVQPVADRVREAPPVVVIPVVSKIVKYKSLSITWESNDLELSNFILKRMSHK